MAKPAPVKQQPRTGPFTLCCVGDLTQNNRMITTGVHCKAVAMEHGQTACNCRGALWSGCPVQRVKPIPLPREMLRQPLLVHAQHMNGKVVGLRKSVMTLRPQRGGP